MPAGDLAFIGGDGGGVDGNAALLADLPQGVDPCGERGEFHSCAVAGPMFRKRISVAPGVVVERDGFVFADLEVTEETEFTTKKRS